MFAAINALRSADFAITDFRFQKIVFNALLQIAAGGGFTAAEDASQRVSGMHYFRVREQLQHTMKGTFIDPAQRRFSGLCLLAGLNIKQGVTWVWLACSLDRSELR